MSTTLGWPSWGSGPTISLWYGYDYQRSGADMQYRIYGEVNTSGASLYFGYSIDADVYLDGTWKYGKHLKDNSPSNWSNTLTFDSGWQTVANKVSGSTSCSIKLSTNAPRGNSTWNYTLTVLPAGSDISAPNGTLGVQETITITKRNPAFTDTVTWSCGSQSGTIVTDTLAGSADWTPPLSLASEVTDSTSVPIKLTTTTKSGGSVVQTKDITITCAIPASVKPTASVAISDPTGNLATYGAYVQTKSTLRAVVTATEAYNSPINTYSVQADGNTYTGADTTTPVLQNAGAQTVTATATDKRGRTSDPATASYTVLAYLQPYLSACYIVRGDSDGTENPEGHYMVITFSGDVTPLNNVNSATWAVRYKVAGSGTWTNHPINALNGTYHVVSHQEVIAAADADAFDVEVTITDDFGMVIAGSGNIPIAYTIMNWRVEGDGMAIGGINTQAGLQIYMDEEHYGDADFQGDIQQNGTNIFPVSVSNGGLASTTVAEAIATLLTGVTEYTDSATRTGQNQYTRDYHVTGDGLVYADINTACDTTNNNGSTVAEIMLNDVWIADEYNRTDVSSGAAVAAQAVSLMKVSNGDKISFLGFSTKSGTKTIKVRLLAFGCTLT